MTLPNQLSKHAMTEILAFCLCLTVAVPAWADGSSAAPSGDASGDMIVPIDPPAFKKPLQGSVEQSGLQGGTQSRTLRGGAEGENWTGDQQHARTDQSRSEPMQGSASQSPMALNAMNDPDSGDQELQIEWDSWRNNLMQTIQQGTLVKINVQNDINFVWDARAQMMLTRYPNGIAAWYSCDVLPNRRIVNIRLTQSSRYPSFDQAVLQTLNELQGNRILVYPRGSKRQIVSQGASVQTAATSQSQNFQFGDVERQRR